MIIIKYVFLFLVFICTSSLGKLISKKYKNRVKELKDFKEICNMIDAKIKFTYEPLGEIFEEISLLYFQKRQAFGVMLKEISEKMKIEDFKIVWEDCIERQRNNLNLNEDDINIIKGLSKMLGRTDVQGQLSEITLTMDFLDTQIQEAEIECDKNHRMYRSLGTIIGLAIIIILI